MKKKQQLILLYFLGLGLLPITLLAQDGTEQVAGRPANLLPGSIPFPEIRTNNRLREGVCFKSTFGY